MASFTAVHRLLGRPPGPLTTEMKARRVPSANEAVVIDEAITLGAAETNDLDFKQELPPTDSEGDRHRLPERHRRDGEQRRRHDPVWHHRDA